MGVATDVTAGVRQPEFKPPSRWKRTVSALGPAFVAAVAYIDPGNVATNLTAGAQYGYMLVWVLVLATAAAALVQYLSAKLGLATGQSLPALLGDRLPTRLRRPYWAQAEIIAIATDFAEIVGGAIALQLLFGLPLPVGAIVIGIVSMVLLVHRDRRGPHSFERLITGMLLVIALGFGAGLLVSPPDAAGVLSGMVPQLDGTHSLLLAAGMLGATVMPHVVYLHSALAHDRFGAAASGAATPTMRRRVLSQTRTDVGAAMAIAGGVNIAMLLLAASALVGAAGTDTLDGAYAAISERVGSVFGLLFALALLLASVASTSVGTFSGSVIMEGLLHKRIPLTMRRVITIAPAVIILLCGVEPTFVLILSQVVLSFGIPFAIIPLAVYTSRRSVMGPAVNSRLTTVLAAIVCAFIVALNLVLLYLVVAGT